MLKDSNIGSLALRMFIDGMYVCFLVFMSHLCPEMGVTCNVFEMGSL